MVIKRRSDVLTTLICRNPYRFILSEIQEFAWFVFNKYLAYEPGAPFPALEPLTQIAK